MDFKGIKYGGRKILSSKKTFLSAIINKRYSLKNIIFTGTIGIKFVIFLMEGPFNAFIIVFNTIQIRILKKEGGLLYKISN